MQIFLMADLSKLALFALPSGRAAELFGSVRSLRHQPAEKDRFPKLPFEAAPVRHMFVIGSW
jgi:hypothetical protein